MNIYLYMYECICEHIYIHTQLSFFVCFFKAVGEFRNKYFQAKSASSFKQMIITLKKVDSLPDKASQITGDQHEGPVVLTNSKFSFKELQP